MPLENRVEALHYQPMTDPDRLDRLEKRRRLRESGALDDAEFAREKANILAQFPPGMRRSSSRGPIMVGIASFLILAMSAIGWALWPRHGQPDPIAQPTPVTSASPRPAPGASPSQVLSPADELTLAFQAATGRTSAFVTASEEGQEQTTKPLRLLRLPFGPVLLTATEIKDGCHACAGAIGVYYLDQQGMSFTVKARWPEAITGWGWGAPPTDWYLTDKFTTYPALYASGAYTGQGYTCGTATLTELRPEGPVESDMIPLSYSNAGDVDPRTGKTFGGEPARDDEGEIANIVKDRSFEVRVTGAAGITERYERRGDKFVRMVRESRLSC